MTKRQRRLAFIYGCRVRPKDVLGEGQPIHLQGRPMDIQALRALEFLADNCGSHWMEISPLLNAHGLNSGNVVTLMRYQGLIEGRKPVDPNRYGWNSGISKSGEYRMTTAGFEWIDGKIAVPYYAFSAADGFCFGLSDGEWPTLPSRMRMFPTGAPIPAWTERRMVYAEEMESLPSARQAKYRFDANLCSRQYDEAARLL